MFPSKESSSWSEKAHFGTRQSFQQNIEILFSPTSFEAPGPQEFPQNLNSFSFKSLYNEEHSF